MTAHFDYQIILDKYQALVNEKKEIERKIHANVGDESALIGLRSDFRAVVAELEEIYTAKIEYFKTEPKPY